MATSKLTPFDGQLDDEQPSSSLTPFTGQLDGEKPRTRGAFETANDLVIEGANAAAGGVASLANMIRPGNAVSSFIDENIIKAGEAKQSDVVQAAKQTMAQGIQDADGIGGELAAVGKYAIQNPLLAASQAAGSFAVPGAAAKVLGRVGGIGAGAALAGGDAAGTAYELSSKAGATDEQALAAGRGASVIPALVGGVTGAFGAEKLLAGGKGFNGGLVSRALKTGASEAGQEAFEEGVTQYEGQRAAMPYDATIDPTKGVAGAAGMGAIMGGATGAGVSLLTGNRDAAPIVKPSQAMGIDPAAGPLSRAAATAVDSGATIQPEQVNVEQAQVDPAVAQAAAGRADEAQVIDGGPDYSERNGEGIAQEAAAQRPSPAVATDPLTTAPITPAPEPLPLEARSLDELRQSLRNAQDPAIRKTVAAEIRRRRESMPDPLQQTIDQQTGEIASVVTPPESVQASQEEQAAPAAEADLSAPPRQQVGQNPDGFINQNAQMWRDMSDRRGLTEEIEREFSTGKTAGQVTTTLSDKIAFIPKEDRTNFIVGVRGTLGIPSMIGDDGDGAFPAWKAGYEARRTKKGSPNVSTTPDVLRNGSNGSSGAGPNLSDAGMANDVGVPDGAAGAATPVVPESVQSSAGDQPATGQAALRPERWRQNALQAGKVARTLGLDPKGKRLAEIVAEIDAKDVADVEAKYLDQKSAQTYETAPQEVASVAKEFIISQGFDDVSFETANDNPKHLAAAAVAKMFGRTYTVFKAKKKGVEVAGLNGIATFGGKDIFISSRANQGPLKIAFHELYHSLPDDIRKPLNKELMTHLKDGGEGQLIEIFGDGEEAAARFADALSGQSEFWSDLRKKLGGGEFNRIITAILQKFDALIDEFAGRDASNFMLDFVKDVKGARAKLVEAVAEANRRAVAEENSYAQANVQNTPQGTAGQAKAAPVEASTAARGDAASNGAVSAAPGAGDVQADGVKVSTGKMKVHHPSGIPPYGGGIIEVDAQPVQIKSAPAEFEYVAYKQGNNTWRVVEKTTGLAIADSIGKTLSEAVAKANKYAGAVSPEIFRKAVTDSEILNPNQSAADLSKNKPKADTSAEPVQETAKTEQVAKAPAEPVNPTPQPKKDRRSMQEKVERPVKDDEVVATTGKSDAEGERKFYVTMVRGDRVARLAGPFDTKEEADAMVRRAQDAANEADPRSAFDAFGVSAVTAKEHKPGTLNGVLGIDSAPAVKPKDAQAAYTNADALAAEKQVAQLIESRIEAMQAAEVQKLAKRFLPTMGVKPPIGKSKIAAAVTDFTKVNVLAAADEFGVEVSASIKKVLEAQQEGRLVEDLATVDATTLTIPMGGSEIDIDLGKPAWQATQEEVKKAVADAGYSSEVQGKYNPMRLWYEEHSKAIEKAAKAGRTFPDELLYELRGLIRNDLNDEQADEAADAMVDEYRNTGSYTKAVQVYRDFGKPKPPQPKAEKPADAQFSVADGGVTESEAFKKWFGDSKVVDADGKPLVVFHGTPDARFINETGIFATMKERMLKWGKTPESERDAMDKRAFFFTSSERVAKTYADPKRAFDYQAAEEAVIPVYVSIKNPIEFDAKGLHWREAQKEISKDDFVVAAKKAGHDGVIIKNVRDSYDSRTTGRDPLSDVFVAFTSNQIKSSTKNRGTFDPANPDIRLDAATGDSTQTTYTPASEAQQKAVTAFADRLSKNRDSFVLMDAVKPSGARQQEAQAVANLAKTMFGREAVFVKFKGRPLFNGAVSTTDPGKIFVNIESARPMMAVLGHELLHELRKSNPAAYNQLAKTLKTVTKDDYIYEALLKKKYRDQGLNWTPQDISEELYGDIVGDNFMDPKFWEAIAGDKPIFAKQLYRAVMNWLDKIASMFKRLKVRQDGSMVMTLAEQADGSRPFGTQKYLQDIEAARAAVAQAMGQFKNGGRGKDALSVSDRGTLSSMPENQAPGPQGDAQQGADKGNAVTAEQEEANQPADGFTRLYHAGSDPAKGGYFKEVPSGGVFDGMFSLRGRWGNYGTGAKYFADVADDKVLTQHDLDYEIDYDKASEALRNVMPWVEEEDFDTAWSAVVEDKADRIDEDDLLRIMQESDIGAAKWEAQRRRGMVAKALGYQAVEMDDENGTSILIVSGTPLTRVIQNDQSAPDTGGAYFSIADTVEQIKAFGVKTAPKNTWAHYRGMAMQALGRRQIVDLYAEELPQLEHYNDLVQRMDAEKNETGAEADKLAQDWSKLKDGEDRKLAELMHDATLSQVDPSKAMPTGFSKKDYDALKGRYDAMTPEAKRLFGEARDMYADHFRAVQKAIKERIERSEMSDGQKRQIMAKMDEELFKELKGVYFPLARFGQYVIVVKDANGEVKNVTRAETVSEAEEARKELMKAFPKLMGNTVGKVLKQAEFNAGRDAVGKGFMADLMGALDAKGVDDELRDTVAQLYLSSLPDLSWAKHGIHRKGTPGFSQDARRAFAQNMFHGARYLAKLRYADQLQDELTEMQEHIKAYEGVDEYDSVQAQQVVDEMVKRHESMMNPKSSPVSTALTSAGFFFHMGLSPASAMVNLTQTALVAFPQIGAKWGFTKSSAALLKASEEVVRAKNDLSKVLKGDELDALNQAIKDGTIDVTMAHDLAGISQGEDQGVMWKVRPMMRAASFLFHHAEKFNRQATFIAAYRLAKAADPNAKQHQLYEAAQKATYDGHFDYSAGNRPRLMQGNWQKVIFLFKQYGQNMVYSLARNAFQSFNKDLKPEERKQAREALAGMLAMHAAAAGVLGLPLVGPLLTVASFIGGDDDEPWDAEVAMQNAMADMLGKDAAEVIARGFSRLTPFDLSGRVALNKLILPDVQEGLEGQDWAQAMLSAAAGPVAGIGVNWAKGLQKISEGDYLRGMEDIMPRFISSGIKGIRYGMEGAQDRTGITITDEVGTAGVVGQALGLSPSQVRRDTERRSAIYGYDKALMERRSVLMRMFAEARINGDEETAQEVQKDIQAFNQKHPNRRITPMNTAQSIRNRRKRVAEAEQGIYLPSKRRDAIDAVSF